MKEKIVILITGQKKRLELLSKIKYIIRPLHENFNVSVLLSLSNSDNFTNWHKYKKNFFMNTNLCNIDSHLKDFTYFVNDIVYPDIPINNKLSSMYDKQHLGQQYTIQRSHNHIKQYYTLYNSWSLIKKLNPDLLIRIRDDATLSTLLKLSDLPKECRNCKKCIITPKENAWKGINDKFAIVSKDAIETYLTKPLEVYKKYDYNYTKRIKNPEHFLQHVYTNYGVTLFTSNINLIIIGQNNNNRKKYWKKIKNLKKNNLLFVHTPKCGGNFVKNVLNSLNIKFMKDHNKPSINDMITFTVIRHPVERFESLMNYRLDEVVPRGDWPISLRYVYNDPNVSLDEIVKNMSDAEILNFTPYRTLSYWCKDIDICITIDMLKEFLSFFGYNININEFSKENMSKKNRGELTETTKQRIYNLYADDIMLYNKMI